MVVYSWNMLYRNARLPQAYAFISGTDFDVFCLQEVPEDMLARLQGLGFSIAYRRDAEKVFAGRTVSMYNVILSKHPLKSSSEIIFPSYGPDEPLRTRVFRRIMPDIFPETRDRGGLSADLIIDGRVVRVFNLHLILARPGWRLDEFERAMAHRDPSLFTVVCGDFNTLERPHITPLNWLMGAPITDAIFYERERLEIEKRFVSHGLWNPLRGSRTHGLSRSQLDHILVSRHLAVDEAHVLPVRYGSDHHPIRAVISGV